MADQIVEPEIAFGLGRAAVAASEQAAEPPPGGAVRRQAGDFEGGLGVVPEPGRRGRHRRPPGRAGPTAHVDNISPRAV